MKGWKTLRRLRRVISRWGRAGCANPHLWGVFSHTRIESSPQSRRVRASCLSPASPARWVCEYFLTKFRTSFPLLIMEKKGYSYRGFYCFGACIIRDDFDIFLDSNCVDPTMSARTLRTDASVRYWNLRIAQFRQVEFLITEVKCPLNSIYVADQKNIKSLILRFSFELPKIVPVSVLKIWTRYNEFDYFHYFHTKSCYTWH